MHTVTDLVNGKEISSLNDVSIKLYKDYFFEILITRIFKYTGIDEKGNKVEISVAFQPGDLMHILGAHHLLVKDYKGTKFNKRVDKGKMSFEILERINNKEFNKYTPRFICFGYIYQILTNCKAIIFNKEVYQAEHDSDLNFKFVLFEDIYGKKVHLGIDTYKEITYFVKSLLVTSKANQKFIKNQEKVIIKQIEIINKRSKQTLQVIELLQEDDIASANA